MKFILRVLGVFFSIIGLAVLNIGLSYILPYPWSKINILFAVLIILMLWWESGLIVWITFFSSFLIELFVLTPFGIILFSSTISILFSYWLYLNIFTNRSWYVAGVLAFSSLFIYRFFCLITLSSLHLFIDSLDLINSSFFIIIGWELFLTTLLVSVLYFIISRFSKKLRPSPVKPNFFNFKI